MKTFRILALLLAMVMVVSLFASCKKDDDKPPVEPAPEVTTLNLITQGVSNYVIVRDYKAGGDVLNAVASIVSAIKTFTGADVTVKECYNDREDENDVVEANEILVGMTNREESVNALKGKRSNDWVLGVYGNKLVVGSPSDAGTLRAATKLLNDFIYEQGNRYEVKSYVESNGKEGSLQSLTFSTSQNLTETGTYSYSLFEVLGARIDSFAIIYAKDDENSLLCSELANSLCSYISKEAGYELEVKKDTRCYADYEILIGNTERTDDALAAQIGPNDYYIKLIKTETGARLIILFGENAKNSAYNAFRQQIMPTSKTPIQKNLEEGPAVTNTSLT